MDLMQTLGTGMAYANKAQDQDQKLAAQKLTLQRAMQEAQARKMAGNMFTGMFDGPDGGAAPLPGATQLPWTGGAPGAAGATGLPNGGAPPVPGAAPLPNQGPTPQPPLGAPSMGGPAPGAGAPMGMPPQKTNGLSWQQLAAQIKKQAPNADGATIMGVIEQYAPLMNAQSKNDYLMMKMLVDDILKSRGLGVKEDIADKMIGGREKVANINQAGANSRTDKRISSKAPPGIKTDPTYIKLTNELNTAKAKQDSTAIDKAQAKLSSFTDQWIAKSGSGSGAPAKGSYTSLNDLQAAYKKGDVTAEDAQKIAVDNGWAQ